MTQTIPIVRGNTLIYQRGGQKQTLVVGTPAWYAWLDTATAFAFTSDCGTFKERKEQAGNKRGGSYWRAYRQRDSKLHRVYVGKSEELTLQRLNAVGATLAGRDGVEVSEREPGQRVLQGQPGASSDRGRFLQSSEGAPSPSAERGAASARHSSTLPLPLTSLIGREREIAAASTLLILVFGEPLKTTDLSDMLLP